MLNNKITLTDVIGRLSYMIIDKLRQYIVT